MSFGEKEKLEYAKKLVTALSYVGLSKLDRVGLATFANGVGQVLPSRRGRPQLLHILQTLGGLEPEGESDLNQAFKEYAARTTGKGFLIIVSDFFSPSGYEQGLKYLKYKKHDIAIVHLLAEEELRPQMDSDFELQDMENDALARLSADSVSVTRYMKRMGEFTRSLESFCLAHRVMYVQTRTSLPFEDLIVEFLRAGLWQSH